MKILHATEIDFAPKPNIDQWIESTELPEQNLITSCFGIIKHENKYLLIEHTSRGWEMPGGHVDNNETALECFQREILEEAGVTCKNIEMIAHQRIELLNQSKPENYKYPFPVSHQVVFRAEVAEIKEFNANLDSKSRRFFTLDELSKEPYYSKYKFLFNLA